MENIVLITGATSGIGEACAHAFAAKGWHVIITGRRQYLLTQLQQLLIAKYNILCHVLCFDVQHKDAVFEGITSLPVEWQNVTLLINNAGLALGRDSFDTATLNDWETMIDTNVKGLLYVSRAVLPLFTSKNRGHIINIGSVAGKEVYDKGNVYCATKHAVDAISKAQRIELLPYNIKVTCVHPGAVQTQFSNVRFKGDNIVADSVYQGYTPLQAIDIASVILYAASLPPHVCINDMVVTCTAQGNATTIYKS